MTNRLELHNIFLQFCPNVYTQTPSNMQIKYPCIVYTKAKKAKQFGNNKVYLNTQEWGITVIDRNPDSLIADNLESYFQYCAIEHYYSVEGLNHTALKLHF